MRERGSTGNGRQTLNVHFVTMENVGLYIPVRDIVKIRDVLNFFL